MAELNTTTLKRPEDFFTSPKESKMMDEFHRGVKMAKLTWEKAGTPYSLTSLVGRPDYKDHDVSRKGRLWACQCIRRLDGEDIPQTTRRDPLRVVKVPQSILTVLDAVEDYADRRRPFDTAHLREIHYQARRKPHPGMNYNLHEAMCDLLAVSPSWRMRIRSVVTCIHYLLFPAGLPDVSARKRFYLICTDLFREVLGHPTVKSITPAVFEFGGGIVTKMATAIYEEKRWQDMPVLADALEDAGCDNEQVIQHCRMPGDHFRGCWVIDALTGHDVKLILRPIRGGANATT